MTASHPDGERDPREVFTGAIAAVESLDAIELSLVVEPHKRMAVAAAYRCAHLLGSIAGSDDTSPLVPMALRDVVETAVNGMLCILEPAHAVRFMKQDYVGRMRVVKRTPNADERLVELSELFADVVDQKDAMKFNQRVDHLFNLRPGLFNDRADADRLIGLYIFVSNSYMHGGAATLDAYLKDGPNGLERIRVPDSFITAKPALDVGGRLFERLVGLIGEKSFRP